MPTLALLVVAGVTAGLAQSVEVDLDEGVGFSDFKTYAWRGGTQARNDLTQRRIMQAIDAELQARGLAQVDNEGDLYVTTFAVVDQRTRNRAVSLGVGVRKRTKRSSVSIGGSTGGRPRQISTGTLVIDIIESADETLIWQAIATDTLKSDPKKNSEMALDAVRKAFERFPLERRD